MSNTTKIVRKSPAINDLVAGKWYVTEHDLLFFVLNDRSIQVIHPQEGIVWYDHDWLEERFELFKGTFTLTIE